MATSIRTKQQEKDAKEKQAQQASEDSGLLLKLESLEARSIDHFSRKCLRKYFLVKLFKFFLLFVTANRD
jgi:hypothetical protein